MVVVLGVIFHSNCQVIYENDWASFSFYHLVFVLHKNPSNVSIGPE